MTMLILKGCTYIAHDYEGVYLAIVEWIIRSRLPKFKNKAILLFLKEKILKKFSFQDTSFKVKSGYPTPIFNNSTLKKYKVIFPLLDNHIAIDNQYLKYF